MVMPDEGELMVALVKAALIGQKYVRRTLKECVTEIA
jgi:hypothetical protein